MLLPLTDAVTVAVPAATAATVNVAFDEPAGTVRDAGTVATAALLLESEMLAPPVGAAAVSVTVPWALPPAAMLVGFNATLDTAVVPVAPVGEEPPH